MNNFKLTSMFIGILLDKRVFSNLFVKLSTYLKENNLQGSIILQDINSLHLSLYYLDNRFSEEEKIQRFINRLRKNTQNLKLNVISFNYFYDQKIARTCYFECSNKEKLIEVNKILKLNLPNKVLENTYNFVPHITLFEIKGYSFFKKHKKNLEKILIDFSKRMGSRNIFKSVNIFQVDSTKEPELQIPS